jgi:hypothetical protein
VYVVLGEEPVHALELLGVLTAGEVRLVPVSGADVGRVGAETILLARQPLGLGVEGSVDVEPLVATAAFVVVLRPRPRDGVAQRHDEFGLRHVELHAVEGERVEDDVRARVAGDRRDLGARLVLAGGGDGREVELVPVPPATVGDVEIAGALGHVRREDVGVLEEILRDRRRAAPLHADDEVVGTHAVARQEHVRQALGLLPQPRRQRRLQRLGAHRCTPSMRRRLRRGAAGAAVSISPRRGEMRSLMWSSLRSLMCSRTARGWGRARRRAP